jgi:hypothetical protein
MWEEKETKNRSGLEGEKENITVLFFFTFEFCILLRIYLTGSLYYLFIIIIYNIVIIFIHKTAFIAHNTTSNVEFY